MKTVVIIQARLGSTRLPGKVLEDLEGETVLGRTVLRARAMRGVDEVMVATTDKAADAAVVRESERLGCRWYRGPEDDVLARYLGAAKESQAELVVRVTSDCPLLDPGLSSEVVERLAQDTARFDYASNGLVESYPRGLDTEALTREALERAGRLATTQREREHVTLYLTEHPEIFRLSSLVNDVDLSRHRWTVDTRDDLRLVREIYRRLCAAGPLFSWRAVLELLAREPELCEINAGVRQKQV